MVNIFTVTSFVVISWTTETMHNDIANLLNLICIEKTVNNEKIDIHEDLKEPLNVLNPHFSY